MSYWGAFTSFRTLSIDVAVLTGPQTTANWLLSESLHPSTAPDADNFVPVPAVYVDEQRGDGLPFPPTIVFPIAGRLLGHLQGSEVLARDDCPENPGLSSTFMALRTIPMVRTWAGVTHRTVTEDTAPFCTRSAPVAPQNRSHAHPLQADASHRSR
jgi:hypothetical protein